MNLRTPNLLFYVFVGGVLLSALLYQLVFKTIPIPLVESTEEVAKRMVEACRNADLRSFCYETEVPKLVDTMSTYDIFNVIRTIRRFDEGYVFCHVLAHELGAHEVSLDPDNWINVLAKGPTDGLCSNGFAHGAIVTRFSEGALLPEVMANIIPDLKIVCESRAGWNPTSLHKAMCYHGLGHVLVHMTVADVPKALANCDVIAQNDQGDYRRLCHEGVYMQLFQPLEPEDQALIDRLPYQPQADTVWQFCTDFSDNQDDFNACWREAWTFFDLTTRAGIEAYCHQQSPGAGRKSCYVTVYTINGRQNLGNPEKIVFVCNQLAENRQGRCLAHAANAFLEEDPELVPNGVALCAKGSTESVRDECYDFLSTVAVYNFHPQSAPHRRLCELLPPAWHNACLATPQSA